jgi:hypothetical protein
VVALFWAAEHNTRAEVVDQLDAELEEMRRIAGLIEQRKNNLPPIDFESEEDSLDGFDLAEFSPR